MQDEKSSALSRSRRCLSQRVVSPWRGGWLVWVGGVGCAHWWRGVSRVGGAWSVVGWWGIPGNSRSLPVVAIGRCLGRRRRRSCCEGGGLRLRWWWRCEGVVAVVSSWFARKCLLTLSIGPGRQRRRRRRSCAGARPGLSWIFCRGFGVSVLRASCSGTSALAALAGVLSEFRGHRVPFTDPAPARRGASVSFFSRSGPCQRWRSLEFSGRQRFCTLRLFGG
jgi:hypothetical protein